MSNLTWSDVKSLFYNEKIEGRGKRGTSKDRKRGSDANRKGSKRGSRIPMSPVAEGDATSGEDNPELCWNCAEVGHGDAMCPIPRRCYVCLLQSHEAHQCQSNPVVGSITFNPKETCENCKLPGHAETRCKAEGGVLYQRSGLNLSKQTVFSRPLVIKVQEDNGPPPAEVNAARSVVIAILERYLNANAEGGDGGEETSAAEGNILALYNTMLSPAQQQQQHRQLSESPNPGNSPAEASHSSGNWASLGSTTRGGRQDHLRQQASYINPNLLSDVEIFQLAARLLKSKRCKRNEELSLKRNLDLLKRMISSVGIPPPAGSGTSASARRREPESVAHLLTDDNMLHELKVSNLDFHIVFGGKVEQYYRTKGNEASEKTRSGTKYEPVGGELRPAANIVKQFRYNPEKHGHRAAKLRQKQKAMEQEAMEKFQPQRTGGLLGATARAEKVQTKMELLEYVLASDPTTPSSTTSPKAAASQGLRTSSHLASPACSSHHDGGEGNSGRGGGGGGAPIGAMEEATRLRLEEGKNKLKESQAKHSGPSLIPQAPTTGATKKMMSNAMVSQWERHQRVVQNPRQVRSVRMKDTAFSKETFTKTRPMPASWTTGGKDAVTSYEEQMVANDVPIDTVELLPPDVVHPMAELEEELRENERRRRKLYGPSDQGETFSLTRLDYGTEEGTGGVGLNTEEKETCLREASDISGFMPPQQLHDLSHQETIIAPPAAAFYVNTGKGPLSDSLESTTTMCHYAGGRLSDEASGTAIGSEYDLGSVMSTHSGGGVEPPERAHDDPGGITSHRRIPQPPIANWDVFKTLGFDEGGQGGGGPRSKKVAPCHSRVNAEQYQEAKEDSEYSLDVKKTTIVVNPINVTGLSQHWRQRFNNTKLKSTFDAQEKLAARSSLRRVAASSNEQLARCAEDAMTKGRQWHVAHGIYRKKSDVFSSSSKTPRPSTARASTVASPQARRTPSLLTPRSTGGATDGSATRRLSVAGGSKPTPAKQPAPPTTTPSQSTTAKSSAIKKAAMNNSIWSKCCTHMADQAVNHQHSQNVYRSLREYLDKIKAPHTHQGHQFVNAFVKYLAFIDTKQKDGSGQRHDVNGSQSGGSRPSSAVDLGSPFPNEPLRSTGCYTESPGPMGSGAFTASNGEDMVMSGSYSLSHSHAGFGYSTTIHEAPSTEVSLHDLERLVKMHCQPDQEKWPVELGKIVAFLRTLLVEEGIG